MSAASAKSTPAAAGADGPPAHSATASAAAAATTGAALDVSDAAAAQAAVETLRARAGEMPAFVESCVETAIGRALSVERGSRHRPRAHRLLRILRDKKAILVTTHQNPDPDALASSYALTYLLRVCFNGGPSSGCGGGSGSNSARKATGEAGKPGPKVVFSVKGSIGGGYNKAFAQLSDMKPTPWEEIDLAAFDATVLLDVQPNFKQSSLPQGTPPTAVIDHHRSRGRRPHCPFCDIRTDVGATSSIIFSYFMELDVDIPPDLAATLLFAIETDLAGAAGQPGDLDNMALSSLTLLADTRRLYRMRYVDLPQSIYTSCYQGLANAVSYDRVMVTHLDPIESPEAPAVIADFLLRYEPVKWALVTALSAGTPPTGSTSGGGSSSSSSSSGAGGNAGGASAGGTGPSLQLSLRTSDPKASAADAMRRLVRGLGEGGGHRTKAGGSVPLKEGTAAEVERLRTKLRKRLLRGLRIPAATRGQRLVPKSL